MSWHVAPANPSQFPAACRALAVGAGNPDVVAARLLGMLGRGDVDPAGLFVAATAGGLVRGAALATRQAGNQATLMPPNGPDAAAADAAGIAALDWLRAGGTRFVQGVLRVEDARGAAALTRVGVTRTTRLVFFGREVGNPYPVPPLTVEQYSPANADAFADVLLASYTDTLDCPELNDARPIADVIDGYRDGCATGSDDWFLATLDGEPAAVLMLAAGEEWGLTYLGVAPFARGRGLGTALTRFAIRKATGPLALNVDVRNDPAARLYTKHGFRRLTERDVFLRLWPAVFTDRGAS